MSDQNSYTRKKLLGTASAALGGCLLTGPILKAPDRKPQRKPQNGKMREAVVGMGVGGASMCGRNVVSRYPDQLELVGICDTNPGRLKCASEDVGAGCPTFTRLDEMLQKARPDRLVVTTWDWEHHNCIITALEHGVDVVCEKPLTIDEEKCQMIIDADKKYRSEEHTSELQSRAQ